MCGDFLNDINRECNVTRLPEQSNRKRRIPRTEKKKGKKTCDYLQTVRRYRWLAMTKNLLTTSDQTNSRSNRIFLSRCFRYHVASPAEAATSETRTGLTRFTSARFTLAARNKYGKSITRLASDVGGEWRRVRWGYRTRSKTGASALRSRKVLTAAQGAKKRSEKEQKRCELFLACGIA